MGEKGKFLVTNEGRFDLAYFTWDDQQLTDFLVRGNPIDPTRPSSSAVSCVKKFPRWRSRPSLFPSSKK